MTKFYVGFSFPNGLEFSHSFYFFLFLSSFITPLICLNSFLLLSFLPLSFFLPFTPLFLPPSLGIGGNLQ